jgi:hypothetical protein
MSVAEHAVFNNVAGRRTYDLLWGVQRHANAHSQLWRFRLQFGHAILLVFEWKVSAIIVIRGCCCRGQPMEHVRNIEMRETMWEQL